MSRRDPEPAPDLVTVEHVCTPPKWMTRAVIGLAVLVTACLGALAVGGIYVYQADQYVTGRGEYRDLENQRTNQRINDAICDLLDQLPEGGLLDRPRTKYGCGPGIPLEELTPEEQAQIAGRAPVAPPSSPSPEQVAPDRSPMDGAVPVPPPAQPPEQPAVPPTSPEPAPSTPPPLIDLGGITRPVCDVVRICF